jgi:GT2 family glycosyltransferase
MTPGREDPQTQEADVRRIVCDLILLSWNHLEETQPCLETLFAATTVPCRLFIVDNGSEPAVRTYLKGVQPQGCIREVVLLQNDANEGFPRGMNRGLRASTAPYACILNNDLIFTAGWLEELIALAQAHRDLGVINPSSSTFGEAPAPGQALEAYAARLRQRAGQYTEVGMCIGFCMLITREVLQRIGGFSEEVDRIFFEDEDFCMRVQQAGFRCAVAHGAYVYHAEHKTVRKMPEREALFARNRDWCARRWGRRVRVLWPRFEPLQAGSPELRRWLEQLVGLARRRTHVYAYAVRSGAADLRALCVSAGIVPHADVQWHCGGQRMVPWLALWRVLVRTRRKPFDVIVTPKGFWSQVVRALQSWHRAIVVEEELEAITSACQQRSRSQS